MQSSVIMDGYLAAGLDTRPTKSTNFWKLSRIANMNGRSAINGGGGSTIIGIILVIMIMPKDSKEKKYSIFYYKIVFFFKQT